MFTFRSLERKDSKTPANDMWHVLNINRRLEAAEATIQGMTSLIDNVSSEIEEMKRTPLSSPPVERVVTVEQPTDVERTSPTLAGNSPIQGGEAPEPKTVQVITNTVNTVVDQEVVKKLSAKVKGLEGKLDGLDVKLGRCATKHEVEGLCDTKKVSCVLISRDYCT